MDHGASMGPIEGLTDPVAMAYRLGEAGATAVFLHKGLARMLASAPCGLIVHLSASTHTAPDPNLKVLASGVEDALRIGADAVSVHVNLGSDSEAAMVADLGAAASACEEWGLPLVAMVYPRGPRVKDPLDADLVSKAARLGAELGADVVKTNYTGDPRTFARVVEGCPVPVIIAGGPRCESDRQTLEMVRGAMDAGAMGVAFGRNVFSHRDPPAMVRALRAVVVDDALVEDALEALA
jgi:fructose-bisphosphate aldolase/2-amino-3,7-dideoxy-D-threo-hept-6-ulosonate synthase